MSDPLDEQMITDLIAFIEARLDEREHLARRAQTTRRWETIANDGYGPQIRVGDGPELGDDSPEWYRNVDLQVWTCTDEADGCPDEARGWIAEAKHIALHDPVRVLAEIDAMRQIIELIEETRQRASENAAIEYFLFDMMDVGRLLALPYADHPDYREEWRP